LFFSDIGGSDSASAWAFPGQILLFLFAGNFVALCGDVPVFLLDFLEFHDTGRPLRLLLPIAV
jgi:hypothetical protein